MKIFNHKIITATFILCILVTACVKKKKPDVAHNKSSGMSLTHQQFNDWLGSRDDLLLKNKQQKIHSFFLEQLLLDNKDLLAANQLDEIDFISQRKIYNKSRQPHKTKMYQAVEVSEHAILELSKTLKTSKPERVRLYQIYKRYPPNANQKTKDKLLQKMRDIKQFTINGESFKLIAESESDSQSRIKKGLIGNVYAGLLSPQLDGIVMKMQAGEISQIIKGPKGLLLFYCEKRIPAVIKSQIELKERALNQLKKREFDEVWHSYQQKLLKQQQVIINWNNISNKANNDSAVVTKDYNLSLKQLEWLLNNKTKNKQLSKYSEKRVTNEVSNYVINKKLFELLSGDLKKDLKTLALDDKNQMIIQQVMLKLVNKHFTVPNIQQLKNYFNDNSLRYERPAYYDVSGIAIKIENDEKSEAYQKAEKLLNSLQHEELTFKQAANEFSVFSDMYTDGNIGWLSRNQLPHALGINLLKTVLTLETGQLSNLVESQSGYIWIMRLNEFQGRRQMSFSEAKIQVESDLANELLDEIEFKIIQQLLDSQDIVIH